MKTPDVTCECGHRRDNHNSPCYWEHCDCQGFVPRDRSVKKVEDYAGKQVDVARVAGHRRQEKGPA